MSQYLGRNKNKSKQREIAREVQRVLKDNAPNMMNLIARDMGIKLPIKQKETCLYCGRLAYKSDGHGTLICEKRAYSGNCSPESESVENRLIEKQKQENLNKN